MSLGGTGEAGEAGMTPISTDAGSGSCVHLAYADEDGDGVGTGGLLCADDYDGPVVDVGGDCNDADPEIGPHMVDLPGDGLDRDCDGYDQTCSDQPTHCPCDGLEPFDVGALPHCDGYDLLISYVKSCPGPCVPDPFVRIANAGTLDVDGPIYITGEGSSEFMLVEGLAAGAVTEPVNLYGLVGPFHVRASADADCNPDNDTDELSAPTGMRTFCSVK